MVIFSANRLSRTCMGYDRLKWSMLLLDEAFLIHVYVCLHTEFGKAGKIQNLSVEKKHDKALMARFGC